MTQRKPYELKAKSIGDVYAAIVAALVKPKTANQIAEEVGVAQGSVHVMLRRLVTYGAIERTQTRHKGNYLYIRLKDTVSGEDVLRTNKNSVYNRGNAFLAPTIEGARVIDFSRKDLADKVNETQRMTLKERRAKGAQPSGGSFTMFDYF